MGHLFVAPYRFIGQRRRLFEYGCQCIGYGLNSEHNRNGYVDSRRCISIWNPRWEIAEKVRYSIEYYNRNNNERQTSENFVFEKFIVPFGLCFGYRRLDNTNDYNANEHPDGITQSRKTDQSQYKIDIGSLWAQTKMVVDNTS